MATSTGIASPAVASLARRYRSMISAGTVFFVLLCGLTAWAGWVREYDAAVDLAGQRVQKEAIRLRAMISVANDHVAQMARWAEDFPHHAPYPGPDDIRVAAQQALANSSNGDVNLDVLANRSSEQRLGLLIATADAARPHANGAPSNLDLALPLLDRFRYAQATIPFLRWSYFFSARKDVLAMAPWAASSDVLGDEPNARSFLEHSWTYEITERGRPENNPQREPYWTRAYWDQAGAGLMVSHGVPVYWGDEFIGVMGADVLLDFLADFLGEFPDPDGLLVITNQHGELLGDRRRANADTSSVPMIDNVLPPELKPWSAGLIGSGENGRLSQGWHVISESIGNPQWTIVYLLPRSVLIARVTKQFAPQLGMTALLLIALAVMNYVLRQWYVAPALSIADFVAHENESPSAEPPPVPHLWQPWVDGMARAFRERREYLSELRTEIGDRKRAEESLRETTRMVERVNRVLKVLSQANEELIRAADEQELFTAMCRVIVETGGYRMAWIGIGEDDGPIRPVAHAGHDEGFLSSGFAWDGDVIPAGQFRVDDSLETGAAPQPWRQAAIERGYGARIVLPLKMDEGRQGLLTVYAAEPHAFGPKETALFVDLANDLAYGVSVMQERQRRAEMERILAHSQKMEALGQLAGGVAHDFNNLLGAILGFANFIAEDSPEETPVNYFARRIITAGRRGKEVVRQILSFARKGDMEQMPINLGDLLAEVHTLAGATLPSTTRLSIENELPGAVVVGDSNSLSRMLLNLCVNANDALGGLAGTLSLKIRPTLSAPDLPPLADPSTAQAVHVWQDDSGTAHAASGTFDPAASHVSLVVSDSGCGMSPDLLSKVFSPFFTTKGKGAGTGLGLAAVHSAVLAHSGALLVQSRENAGTTFEVILPLAPADLPAASLAAPAAVQAPPKVSCRVLLVDDDTDFGDMILAGLERRGAEVAPCSDPLAALSGVRDAPEAWDVLITDQTMPDMTGLELVREVKKIRPDLPCILCTGYTEAQLDAAMLLEAGVFAKLYKPLDIDRLVATLAQAVEGRPSPRGGDSQL